MLRILDYSISNRYSTTSVPKLAYFPVPILLPFHTPYYFWVLDLIFEHMYRNDFFFPPPERVFISSATCEQFNPGSALKVFWASEMTQIRTVETTLLLAYLYP